LKQNLRELVPSIEHCQSCKAAFLKGFFDSEGCVSGRKLTVSNGDLDKMSLVCKLLGELGIVATGPHLLREAGGMTLIKGKLYRVNKNQYLLYVRAGSVETYRDKVGFCVSRKGARLASLCATMSRR